MEVKYNPKGKKGSQCKDCKFFKPLEGNKRNCFGYEVILEGSCNFFKKK